MLLIKEKAKARSEEAGGVKRSFVEERALGVFHAVGEGIVLFLEVICLFLKAMDSVLLTQ